MTTKKKTPAKKPAQKKAPETKPPKLTLKSLDERITTVTRLLSEDIAMKANEQDIVNANTVQRISAVECRNERLTDRVNERLTDRIDRLERRKKITDSLIALGLAAVAVIALTAGA